MVPSTPGAPATDVHVRGLHGLQRLRRHHSRAWENPGGEGRQTAARLSQAAAPTTPSAASHKGHSPKRPAHHAKGVLPSRPSTCAFSTPTV